MEVIEHIKDAEVADSTLHRDAYVGDGLVNFVNTCYTCLKPGGKMFLTTPHLSSVSTLWRVMHYGNPFSYALHIRELSVCDLRDALTKAGFLIDKHVTMHCYDPVQISPETESLLLGLLRKMNCSTDLRDEVQFVLASKPVFRTP